MPSTDPSQSPSADALAIGVRRFFDDLGRDAEELAGRIVVTPQVGGLHHRYDRVAA